MLTLERFEAKLAALRDWFLDNSPSDFDIKHGFVFDRQLSESDVVELEQTAGATLPEEYRSFLLRFGDGGVGPATYRRAGERLTRMSGESFPLAQPFLGCNSPAYQSLSADAQADAYRSLCREFAKISSEHGVLSICDYGCGIQGRLILNGRFRGRVWIYAPDAAYYAPFGGAEQLHDEYALNDWEPTESPQEYSFVQWYESWLDGRLKVADLADRD